VCGAPDAVDAREAATRVAVFALMVRNLVARETAQYGVELRIGLHSGPVLAGVLGVPVPQFTLIGDAVKTVSRIESLGAPGKVLCSAATRALLRGRFRFSARSPLKGRRTTMQTFWLAGPLLTADPTKNRSASQGTGALDGTDTQSMLQLVSRGAADVVPVPMSQNHRPGDHDDSECC
jgi:class 3 adenylate cyclase